MSPIAAVFLMPRPSTAWASAPAVWITAAGWAAAARRRFGAAWIVCPDAVASPEAALGFTRPRPAGTARRPGRLRLLPQVARTALKDLRLIAARRSRSGFAAAGPWQESRLSLVWQQHDFFAAGGRRLADRHGCPLVLFVHAPLVWEAARWGVRRPIWGRWLERRAESPQIAAADLVACVSREVADRIEDMGVPRQRILISPMAVDVERFAPGASGEAVRRRHGLGDDFVFGWIGSFRRFHGLSTALEAFRRMRREAPRSRLLLVGDGFERLRLEALSRQLGLGSAVVFAGACAHPDVPAYLAAMDAALVTARPGDAFHYSPLKMREYMACGVPVAAPAVGEISRLFGDEEVVVLYPPESPAELADAMRQLYQGPERRRALAAAGRRWVEEHGSWDLQLGRAIAALRDNGHAIGEA